MLNSLPYTAPAGEPPFKIALGQWSLHRKIMGPPPGKLERLRRRAAARLGLRLPPQLRGDLDPLDVPAFVRRELDIDAIEWIGGFYADNITNLAYLRGLKRRADDVGVHGTILICENEGPIAAGRTWRRRQVVNAHRKWIDAAATLEARAIRVIVPCTGAFDEQARLAADGLNQIGELCFEAGIDVIVENHGGHSSNPSWLATVMRLADHPRVGVLPDFGNFQANPNEKYDVYEGVAMLMPFARGVSAKCFDFDKRGAETTFDFGRLMRLVVDSGYRGHVGIEYEGDSLSEVEGVRAAKLLLEQVRREMIEETWALKANAGLSLARTHVALRAPAPPPPSTRGR